LKRRPPATGIGWVLSVLLPLAAGASRAFDPEAAEREYRVARRLAAEGSPEAVRALQRVVELDPGGRFADDALVEQALLEGLPGWPEELGRLERAAHSRGAELLDRVLKEFPGGDRTSEARLRRALLRLEPVEAGDSAGARVELLTVAADARAVPWSARARYILGWLDERDGRLERARGAYQRVAVDGSEPATTAHSLAGLGRLELRSGRFGAAARWLQQAVEAGVPEATGAVSHRELAVRSLLRRERGTGAWSAGQATHVATGVRALAGLVRLSDGGVVLGDRRGAKVIRLDRDGRASEAWSLEDPEALAVDGTGRLFAATREEIYQLSPGRAERVAALGSFAPASAILSDPAGHLWVVDRKGARVGRVDPGAREPAEVWTSAERRASLVAWVGSGIAAVDERTGAVFAIGSDGADRVLVARTGLGRPVSAASDPAGQLAVLDGKTGSVVLFDASGTALEQYRCSEHGVARPVAIALGLDGSLDVFDAATGALLRVP
jgi:hypothetical protein